ncbi:hypothetical protein EDD85DRAFT_774494, partial [Armillaria nabsnona]
SSNLIAFLTIVVHYVTNDGKLEELLIDFCELEGAHSRENIAEVVWETLTLYRLCEKVCINNVDITLYADVYRILSSSV